MIITNEIEFAFKLPEEAEEVECLKSKLDSRDWKIKHYDNNYVTFTHRLFYSNVMISPEDNEV